MHTSRATPGDVTIGFSMRLSMLVLVLIARAAQADVGVAVVGVPAMHAPVMAQTQGWLQDHHYAIVGSPFGNAYGTFVDCVAAEDMACAKAQFSKQAKASSIVVVRIDQAGSG